MNVIITGTHTATRSPKMAGWTRLRGWDQRARRVSFWWPTDETMRSEQIEGLPRLSAILANIDAAKPTVVNVTESRLTVMSTKTLPTVLDTMLISRMRATA